MKNRTSKRKEACPHEDAHAAWRCTACGAFLAECGPDLRAREAERAITVDDIMRASDLWIDGPSSLANALARNIRILVAHIRAQKAQSGAGAESTAAGSNVPYPDFCYMPKECAGRKRCPRNPSCCE